MKPFNVKCEVSIPSKSIEYLFISALEGGSNYWCGKVEHLSRVKEEDYYTSLLNGFKCYDTEAEKWYTVNKHDIADALQNMATYHKKHFNDLLAENDDAITADVFLQLCALKSVIYG